MVKNKNKISYSREDRVFNVIVNIIIAVLLIIIAYPLIFVISSSFSSKEAVTNGLVILWPVQPSLEGYEAVFKKADVFIGYRNTILYTVIGTFINIVLTMIAAYPLSRRDLPGGKFITLLFTFTMIFNGGMIPTYMLVKSLGLMNTPLVMVSMGAISAYNLIIARTFIQSNIPLELLEAATRISGNPRFDQVARSHATVTSKHHFRADGGCYHVLDYDQVTKRVQGVTRGQGASTETAWSRGQSWAIYGYTMMYRETKDPLFRQMAERCADFAIDNPNMPADGVPYWDYGAPGEERDSSAGSIMASGLLELSTLVPEKGAKYRAFAVKALTALASPAYFAAPGENGDFLLKHGVGAKPKGSEVDTPLNYGDYYFLEGLMRFRKLRTNGSL